MNKIIAVYEENAGTKSSKRALFLRKMSSNSEMIMIGGFVAYLAVAILHYINPIYGYFWQHKFKPLFPLYIPFIDENTAIGFTILMAIQSIEVFIGTMASGCADFPFMVIVINVRIFSTIFDDNVNKLNKILRKRKKGNRSLATVQLRKIFEMYYDTWV